MASQPPTWMEDLIDSVSGCMEAHDVMGPFGYRWGEEDEFWEIIVYPTPIELVGGYADGENVSPGFSLDIKELSCSFDEVAEVRWQAHNFGVHDFDGPHISIEGVYQGHQIWLRVMGEAPKDEEPGVQLDVSQEQE